MQLLRWQRPGRPPVRLPLLNSGGAGQTAGGDGEQGKPLGQTHAHGKLGDLKPVILSHTQNEVVKPFQEAQEVYNMRVSLFSHLYYYYSLFSYQIEVL